MENISYNIYKGKNVLVTGHTGFKGSWLTIWLKELGANVIGFALEPTSDKDNFVLSNLKDRIIDIRGDIRDSDLLNKVFNRYKPDIVFHLAAQPIVSYSYEQPKYTYEVNIIGTMNVLEAIRHTNETKVGIIVTSDKCYENKEWVWSYRENDAVGGYDPYSSSKACVEILAGSYRNSFFSVDSFLQHQKVIATVRAGNIIGGGDWSLNRIIPDCINALEENADILVRNPAAIRPWQHVLEPLNGYLLLGAKLLSHGPKYSGAWNFGPDTDSAITVEELVDKVIKHWGNGDWRPAVENNNTFHESNLLNLDSSKARKYLDWVPHWNVDCAIEKTIEWYKKYKSEEVYQLCVNQINAFLMESIAKAWNIYNAKKK